MKRFVTLFLCLFILFNCASASPATPTDLVEFDDDGFGYIGYELEREVYIYVEEEPQYFGDTLTLIASLVNFKETDRPYFQWEYSENEIEWFPIEHANNQIFTIEITQNNYFYLWRVVVRI